MKPKRVKTLANIICLMAILVAFTTACGSGSTPMTTAAAPAGPDENPDRLSADVAATLLSLEKLDEYPFYVMHYTGGYEFPRIGSSWVDEANFGCSLFATLGSTGDRYYGRNFDWEFSPALIVFTDPPDGYASVSMVDLTFLGIDRAESMKLAELSLAERTALLTAPSMPFDGMNEYGLAIGMAAVPDEYADDTSQDASKPTLGSIGVIRQILDHARNVDEAVKIFEQYNVDFSGGPPIHYLLADRSGKSILVEFYQAKMIQLPNENAWHVATNHLRCIAHGDGGCWRYRTIDQRLTQLNGEIEAGGAMQLLSDVKQESTQWSSVYDLTSGDIQVVIGQKYNNTFPFHLDLVSP